MGFVATDNTTLDELSDALVSILSEPEDEDGYGVDESTAEKVVRKLLLDPEAMAEFIYTYSKDLNE